MAKQSRRSLIQTTGLLVGTSIAGCSGVQPFSTDQNTTSADSDGPTPAQSDEPTADNSIPEVLKQSLPDPEGFISDEHSSLDRTSGKLAVDTATGLLHFGSDGNDDTVTALGGYVAADAPVAQESWSGVLNSDTNRIGTEVVDEVDAMRVTPESFEGIALRATETVDLYVDGVLIIAGATLVRYSTDRGLFGAIVPDLEGDNEDDDSDGPVSGTVRVGVLQPVSRTGPIGYIGRESLRGFVTGLVYKGTSDHPGEVGTGQTTVSVDDVDYELHVRDTDASSPMAGAAATELVEKQDVDLLFGCSTTAATLEVIDRVVEPTRTPLLAGPTAAPDVTDPEEVDTDLVFRTGASTAMEARAGAGFIVGGTSVQRIYLLGADYGFGRTVVENYRSVLGDERVEIIGEEFVPQQYENWEPLLDTVRAAGADGIVAGFSTTQMSRLLPAYLRGSYDFRVFSGFGSQSWFKTIGQVLREELGQLTVVKLNKANLGPFTSRYHFNQYDNDVNETAMLLYTRAYGTPPLPDIPMSGGFTAASALDQAVRASGSTDGPDIIGTFPGMSVTETIKGKNRYTFPTDSSQAISPITIAKLTPAGQWKASWGAPLLPGEPVATIDWETVDPP